MILGKLRSIFCVDNCLIFFSVLMLKHYTLKRNAARSAPSDVEGLATEPTLPKTNSAIEVEDAPSPSRTVLEDVREDVESGKTSPALKGIDATT